MYETMYHQRLHEPDQTKWQNRIVAWREVVGYEDCTDRRVRLKLKNTSNGETSMSDSTFDLIILGTGYERNGHETLLKTTRHLLHENRYAVERDYRIKFRKDAVADGCGIWLQGCCEDSHGVGGHTPASPTHSKSLTDRQNAQLSDTLLSILAVRGGEMVDSIFPAQSLGKVGSPKL